MTRNELRPISAPLALGLLTVGALLIRLPGFLSHPVVLTEGTTYVTIARNLLAGHGYVGILGTVEPFAPPLYPLLIALVSALSGDAVWSARLISLLAGAALAPAAYLLAARLFSRRSGLWAALLVPGAPLLIEYSSLEWSETLYALLLLLGLAWGWQATQPGHGRAAMRAGLCLGLAYLTRVEGALALVVVVAWVILRRPASPAQDARPRWRAAGRQITLLLGAFALVAAPYVLWLSLTLDRPTLESKSTLNFVISERMAQGQSYVDAAYGLDAEGRPRGVFLERTAQLLQSAPPAAAPLWSANRLRQLMAGLRSVQREMQLYLLSFLLLVAMGAGIIRTLMSPPTPGGLTPNAPGMTSPRAATLYLASFSGAALLTVALVPLVYTRYLFPLLPLWCVWAGVGLEAVAEGPWLQTISPTPRLRAAFTLIVAAVLLLSLPRASTVSSRRAVDVDQQRAGVWLAQQAPARSLRILSVHSQIPFYAGGIHVPMPNGTPAQVLRYADAAQVDVIITSPRKLGGRPGLQAWRQGAALPAPWQAVYRDSAAAGGELIIWEKP